MTRQFDTRPILRALHGERSDRIPFWDVLYGLPPSLAEALLGRPLASGPDRVGQLSDYTPEDQLALADLLGMDVIGFRAGWSFGGDIWVTGEDGEIRSFTLKCRIDTPIEIDYYRNGGILHTVLRKIWASG